MILHRFNTILLINIYPFLKYYFLFTNRKHTEYACLHVVSFGKIIVNIIQYFLRVRDRLISVGIHSVRELKNYWLLKQVNAIRY